MEPRDYMSELWFFRFKSEECDLSLQEFMFMLLEFFIVEFVVSAYTLKPFIYRYILIW